MRVGTRIKELCTALEGMDSATAAEIHQAVFPELDVNSVRTYCSRAVGLGFAKVDRSAYPMRFTIAEGWQRFKAPRPEKQPRRAIPPPQATVQRAIHKRTELHSIWIN